MENSQYLSLHQLIESHAVSFQITHTVSVFTHPYNQTCLFTLCSALAGLRQDKESILGRHISERVCPALSTSGRKPTACWSHWRQRASLRLSHYCLSHSLVLFWPPACLWFHTQHILSQCIRKPLTRPMWCTQVPVGGCRFQGSGRSLPFVASWWFMSLSL